MGYRYVVLGAGRQGTAAAYDLARHGEADEVVTPLATQKLVDKLRTQRHITIEHKTIPGANHFFGPASRQNSTMSSGDTRMFIASAPADYR